MYDKSHISVEILDYLIEHPNAQDTADGIAQWWILERCVKSQTPLVHEALEYLVERGFVIQRKAKDSKIHYRINRRKYREIAATLNLRSGNQS